MGQYVIKPAKETAKSSEPAYTQVEVDYQTDSPRFSAANSNEVRQGIEYMNEHGYAVFSDVLSKTEVTHSIDLFWNHLEEKLENSPRIQRNDPMTWQGNWPGSIKIGLINEQSIGQSDFIWSVRGNPNIKKVFSQVWDSNELFISFDGAGCFRNWHFNEDWRTVSGWYHCDQHPKNKPNRCSIQGLVSLTNSNETTGGLVVVPGSHKRFQELEALANKYSSIDYVSVPKFHQILQEIPPRLIKCQAGDLILWDSRCIHCNTPAMDDDSKVSDEMKTTPLLRLVCYVCMSPASMFVPNMDEYKDIDTFRQLRENFVRNRISCSHWPLQLIVADEATYQKRFPLKLNEYQHSLIVGKDLDPADGQKEIIF